jgi:hypothetical protein
MSEIATAQTPFQNIPIHAYSLFAHFLFDLEDTFLYTNLEAVCGCFSISLGVSGKIKHNKSHLFLFLTYDLEVSFLICI